MESKVLTFFFTSLIMGLLFVSIVRAFRKKKSQAIGRGYTSPHVYSGLKFFGALSPLLVIMAALTPFLYQFLKIKDFSLSYNRTFYAFTIALMGVYFCLWSFFKKSGE